MSHRAQFPFAGIALLALSLALVGCVVDQATMDASLKALETAADTYTKLDENKTEKEIAKEERKAEEAEVRLAREEAKAEREAEERRIREEERREEREELRAERERRRREAQEQAERQEPLDDPQDDVEFIDTADYTAYNELFDFYDSLSDEEALLMLFSSEDAVGVGGADLLDTGRKGTVEFTLAVGWEGTLGAAPELVAHADSDFLRYAIYMYPDAGGLAMIGGSGELETLDFPFTAKEFYHVAFATQGSSTAVFIDGDKKGVLPTGYADRNGLPLSVGSGFVGVFGEVRIWNRALEEGEIRSLSETTLARVQAPPAPVPDPVDLARVAPASALPNLAVYSVTTRGAAEFFAATALGDVDDPGHTAEDPGSQVAGGLDRTPLARIEEELGAAGSARKARFFEGPDDEGVCDSVFNFEATVGADVRPPGTIEFRVAAGWRGDLGHEGEILAYGDADRDRWRYRISLGPDARSLRLQSGADQGEVDFAFDDGQFHHVAIVTEAADRSTVYIDGTSRGTIAAGYASSPFDEHLQIGECFVGAIGEIRFWAKELSHSEIQGYASRSAPTPRRAATLVARSDSVFNTERVDLDTGVLEPGLCMGFENCPRSSGSSGSGGGSAAARLGRGPTEDLSVPNFLADFQLGDIRFAIEGVWVAKSANVWDEFESPPEDNESVRRNSGLPANAELPPHGKYNPWCYAYRCAAPNPSAFDVVHGGGDVQKGASVMYVFVPGRGDQLVLRGSDGTSFTLDPVGDTGLEFRIDKNTSQPHVGRLKAVNLSEPKNLTIKFRDAQIINDQIDREFEWQGEWGEASGALEQCLSTARNLEDELRCNRTNRNARTWLPKTFQRVRLRSRDYEDKYANKDPFQDQKFPRSLGPMYRGYDITRMNPFSLKVCPKDDVDCATDKQGRSGVHGGREVFRTLRPQSRLYYHPKNATQYILPEDLSMSVLNDGFGSLSSQLATSQEEYERTTALSVGASFATYQKTDTSKTLETSNSSFIVADAIVRKFALVRRPAWSMLSDEFRRDVNKLMERGSTYKVENLIEDYGTHYPYAITFGGRGRMEAEVSMEQMATHQTSTQGFSGSVSATRSVQAPGRGPDGSGGPTTGTDVSLGLNVTNSRHRSLVEGLSEESREFWYIGGEGGFSEQSFTVGDNYVPIFIDLRPISELVGPPWFVGRRPSQSDLSLAIGQYLRARELELRARRNIARSYKAEIEKVECFISVTGVSDDCHLYGEMDITADKIVGSVLTSGTAHWKRTKEGGSRIVIGPQQKVDPNLSIIVTADPDALNNAWVSFRLKFREWRLVGSSQKCPVKDLRIPLRDVPDAGWSQVFEFGYGVAGSQLERDCPNPPVREAFSTKYHLKITPLR